MNGRNRPLAAQFQAVNQLLIFLQIVALDVIQQLTTAVGESDQTTATVKVLAVCPQMLSEVVDALGYQSDLNFGRTRVGIVSTEFADD